MNFLDDWINYLLRHRTPPSCLWDYKSLEMATRNHFCSKKADNRCLDVDCRHGTVPGLPTFGKPQPMPNSATRWLDLSGELTAGCPVSRIASVRNRATHRDWEWDGVWKERVIHAKSAA